MSESISRDHENDLISRREAIQALKKLAIDKFNLRDEYEHYIKALIDAGDILQELSGIQPEVIRCKDCRFSDDYYQDGECYCAHPNHELLYIGEGWSFYCANAERREE